MSCKNIVKELNMRRILFSLGIATLLSASAVSQQLSKIAIHDLSSQSELGEVYTKWLNESVVYIITTEEEQYFRQLKSDEERERFIEEFWLRRDPMPETDKNEFREEHYQRITYANQNFAVDVLPGWRTDRGRVYITYGKPYEIQKSESGEIWVFKLARGLFARGPGDVEFVKFEFRDNKLVR
jgi:GWxTD domain-containing protein